MGEGIRSTIYNLFRIPMNLLVLTMLATKSGPRAAFALTTMMLGGALVAQIVLACQLGVSSSEQAIGGRYATVQSAAKEGRCDDKQKPRELEMIGVPTDNVILEDASSSTRS